MATTNIYSVGYEAIHSCGAEPLAEQAAGMPVASPPLLALLAGLLFLLLLVTENPVLVQQFSEDPLLL